MRRLCSWSGSTKKSRRWDGRPRSSP